ncbi:acetyltransferase [Tellurirhabdus bombi]|uniref:acetyltransferase n=1 Tax=Tellurirhabdus bombi TaxID=2907205 RepID=UPI001F259BF4|nr:acetyltransferase [Tellurirhabdus bombi]
MLLFGASGHAKVIISCLEAYSIPVEGIFDDDVSKKSLWNIPVIGKYNPQFLPESNLIISVGYNAIRYQLAANSKHAFGQIVHPTVIIDKNASVGAGSVILQRAVIQTEVKIGRHVIINTSASVDHECVIGDFVHVAPNATLCGNVKVGEGTLIGAGAVVVPNLHIGRWATIGAGAVITRDIPDYAVVYGNPGRIIKYQEPVL